MKNNKKKYVGKIGWCNGKSLGLKSGHYVFVRNVNNDKCDLNTFTSLKDEKGKYEYAKIYGVEHGNIYAIPKKDLDLDRFSGIDKRTIKNVPIKNIKILKKRIKKRHLFFINKFMK